MHHHYEDITSRIAEEPSWYDQNGTPRYGKFTPESCPNIYSNQVVLLRIACQQCGREFLVEIHSGLFGEDNFHPKKLHYGDPPSHSGEDCTAGDTMNCDDIEVVEVWYRDNFEWKRKPELEGMIDEQTS